MPADARWWDLVLAWAYRNSADLAYFAQAEAARDGVDAFQWLRPVAR